MFKFQKPEAEKPNQLEEIRFSLKGIIESSFIKFDDFYVIPKKFLLDQILGEDSDVRIVKSLQKQLHVPVMYIRIANESVLNFHDSLEDKDVEKMLRFKDLLLKKLIFDAHIPLKAGEFYIIGSKSNS